MSLKPLIKKQKLRIDDHKWGTGEIKDWNDRTSDIHLDKETYYPIEGKPQSVQIKIPLNSDNDISITNNRNKVEEIPRKLKREIQDAFRDKKTRQAFVDDLVEVLKDYKSALSSMKNVRECVGKIARHFDLDWSDSEMRVLVEKSLLKFTRYYTDEEGDRYFISIDQSEITIGEYQSEDDISDNNYST